MRCESNKDETISKQDCVDSKKSHQGINILFLKEELINKFF